VIIAVLRSSALALATGQAARSTPLLRSTYYLKFLKCVPSICHSATAVHPSGRSMCC
jgi:hypothetical protein